MVHDFAWKKNEKKTHPDTKFSHIFQMVRTNYKKFVEPNYFSLGMYAEVFNKKSMAKTQECVIKIQDQNKKKRSILVGIF